MTKEDTYTRKRGLKRYKQSKNTHNWFWVRAFKDNYPNQ